MKKYLVFVFVFVFVAQAFAGGILTNTNQSVAFLRNPARDGAIGIDGVYSNPAGVAFLKEGWHFDLNWQTATQTRTVETTSPYLDHTLGTIGSDGNPLSGVQYPTKRYRGHAAVPFIPSASAAYNKGRWSFQFHFAVTGGGGKCEFGSGIGTFESAVGQIAASLKKLSALDPVGISVGAMGYGCESYMEGRQYYYGITFGAAYKITDHLSVYGGIRGLIGSASYAAQIKNIQVATTKGLMNLGDYIDWSKPQLGGIVTATGITADNYQTYVSNRDQLYAAIQAGVATPVQQQQYAQLACAVGAYDGQVGVSQLAAYRNGVDLQCDQTGFGIAPILGIDYKIGQFNFAAKYEFRTKMSLKNSSNLTESTLPATARYVDGTSIREDSPALLALGAQYSPVDIVRINLGYHHFYDKDAKKFNDEQENLSSGTNEYLAGVEVNCTDRLIVSAGGQITRYGLTDDYMSDISFVTNSYSLGFGASYQANKNVKIEAAYFKTIYGHYTGAKATEYRVDDFTRTNDVIGVGLVIDL